MFDEYDLSFATDETQVVYYSEQEAEVYSVQTISKDKDPDFADNRSTIVHALEKNNNPM